MHPLHDECVRLRTVEKKTGKEIAQILGLSQSCVSNWLKPYPLSREDRVEDKALYAECIRLRVNEKKTLTEIAEIIGASKAAISNWLKDYPLTEEERQIGLTRLQAASGPISPTDMLICGECGKTKLSREFNVTRRNVASSKRKRCCKTCSAIKKDAKNSRPPRNVETEKTCNNCGRTDAKELFAQGRNLCLVCFRKDKNERQAYHRAREIDIPEQAKCNSCGKVKPATKFDRNRSTPTGLMPDCKECRQRIERPEKLATTDYRVRKLKLMFRNARIRAKRRGLPFDLDEQWIMDMFGNQRVCPIMSHSGEDYELDWYSKFIVDRSPSLDRVDNSKGYTKDNVWVISQLANKMKNNASLDQLRCFASFWLSILGDVPIHMTQSSRR